MFYKFIYIILLFTLVNIAPVLSQNELMGSTKCFEPVVEDTVKNRVPQYPGGQDALNKYLKQKLKYPKRALEQRIEGRVIFNLEISSSGKISKIMLFKGLYPDCDEEAYYLIKKMPKWIPGKRDGKPVAMEVLLPIPFELP